jgi:hypothetical protein
MRMLSLPSSPAESHPITEGRDTEAELNASFLGFQRPCGDIARRSERNGRCIRHASLRTALSVFPLTVAMIETALRAVLMTTVSPAPLFPQGSVATPRTAITLTPITGAANNENRVACAASLLPKNNLALTRHPRRQVGLDNGDRSWQGRSIPMDGYLMKVANRGPRRYKRRGPVLAPPPSTMIKPQLTSTMIDGRGAPAAPMMLRGPTPADVQKTTFSDDR